MNSANQDSVPGNFELTRLARASATELSQLLRERPKNDRAHIKLDGADLVLPAKRWCCCVTC